MAAEQISSSLSSVLFTRPLRSPSSLLWLLRGPPLLRHVWLSWPEAGQEAGGGDSDAVVLD